MSWGLVASCAAIHFALLEGRLALLHLLQAHLINASGGAGTWNELTRTLAECR